MVKSRTELSKAENALVAFQAKLKTESETYRDRILTEQTRLAEAKAQKAIDSMQSKLEAALADKAAVVGEYTTKMGAVTETAKKAVAVKDEHARN